MLVVQGCKTSRYGVERSVRLLNSSANARIAGVVLNLLPNRLFSGYDFFLLWRQRLQWSWQTAGGNLKPSPRSLGCDGDGVPHGHESGLDGCDQGRALCFRLGDGRVHIGVARFAVELLFYLVSLKGLFLCHRVVHCVKRAGERIDRKIIRKVDALSEIRGGVMAGVFAPSDFV